MCVCACVVLNICCTLWPTSQCYISVNILWTGFDANTLLKSDWTGLMYACDSGHEAIVKLLLSYGADPNYVKGRLIIVSSLGCLYSQSRLT